MPPRAPLLLILAGPAGSGKSTLCDRLVAAEPEFSRVVTTTTRAPREGEIDGIHYHFFSPEEFETRVARSEFIEWAWVHADGEGPRDLRRRYGTLKASVEEPLARGRDLVMSIDVQGVANIRAASAGDPLLARALVTVFIRVDHERLLARMRLRGQDDEAEIARRMETATAELREADKFDHVIESRTREEDFAELLRIVAAARANPPRP
ncbi:MAG: guanylate kinase [Opitutaceae bacterium]